MDDNRLSSRLANTIERIRTAVKPYLIESDAPNWDGSEIGLPQAIQNMLYRLANPEPTEDSSEIQNLESARTRMELDRLRIERQDKVLENLRIELQFCRKTLDEFRDSVLTDNPERNPTSMAVMKLKHDIDGYQAEIKRRDEKIARLDAALDLATKKLEFAESRIVMCGSCKGSGMVGDGDDSAQCTGCGGKGSLMIDKRGKVSRYW